ncbi:MAG: HGGxSTG domain-containing protein [Dongiaceae bacterium]
MRSLPSLSTSAAAGVDPSFSKHAAAATLPPGRRGRLKNGNRAGDFLAALRCGARTRCHGECRQPAMRNGCCRLHGGLSTGPRTPEGLARSRRARLTHGGYSAYVRTLRAEARAHTRRVRALITLMRGRSAGHGVHPSVSAPSRPAGLGPHLRSSAASTSISAGHGVHRSNPVLAPNPRRRPVLSGAAPLLSSGSASLRLGVSAAKPSAAGHGVHPSFRDRLRSSGVALC